jgi:hypothetical protein
MPFHDALDDPWSSAARRLSGLSPGDVVTVTEGLSSPGTAMDVHVALALSNSLRSAVEHAVRVDGIRPAADARPGTPWFRDADSEFVAWELCLALLDAQKTQRCRLAFRGRGAVSAMMRATRLPTTRLLSALAEATGQAGSGGEPVTLVVTEGRMQLVTSREECDVPVPPGLDLGPLGRFVIQSRPEPVSAQELVAVRRLIA